MSRRSRFMALFGNQRSNGFETLLKSAGQHFRPFLSSFRDTLSWKTALLVIPEILGLLANTLTGDERYSRHKRENLTQLVQIQISKKRFVNFFCGFEIYIKCRKFRKKDELHRLSILEIIDCDHIASFGSQRSNR